MIDFLFSNVGARSLRLAAVLIVGGIAASTVSPSAEAAEVTVYTVRSILVSVPTGATATVVYLDAASTIEAEISAGLSADPTRAVAVARQRLLDGGENLPRNLVSAYEDIAEAWSLGITTLPAVVVDRRYVIYGEPNVAHALTKIEAFRRTQP